jgi:glycine/D-amino acid oxidase-like deaminating enzyme
MSHYTVKGPFFDAGYTRAKTREMLVGATRDVSQQAFVETMTNLNARIRHPTPYYETQINTRNDSAYVRTVNDNGVIYGPWLEGVGSRNRTTRFKGYFSFRRAAQKVRRMIPKLTRGRVRTFIRSMR